MRSFLLAPLAFLSATLVSAGASTENPLALLKRDASYQEGLAIVERQIEAAQRAEGLTKRDIEERSLFKRQLESQACGLGPAARSQICRDFVTNNNVAIPRDSYANCNQNTGFCRLKCRNGFCFYGRTPINGQCVDTKFDVNNCGGVGCPAAYNGIGTPACWNYQCTIRCPSGFRITRTSTGQKYCIAA
ncbi:hypothetical protein OIO90_005483 [Microbotryomycetes sp. JL221]|nr:hypothetical protein OIO90_005483 [Microbotryomycetes sp. JL221]